MVKQTFKQFLDNDAPRLAAALSYYTVFSLPPLLVLIISITGVFVDRGGVREHIEGEISGVIGVEAGRQVTAMIENAARPGEAGGLAAAIGFAALLFGATGAFAQLQAAMNKTWEVEPDPDQAAITSFVLKRILSFGAIMTVAFLLLVSLVISAALSAVGDRLTGLFPSAVSTVALRLVESSFALVVLTVLFASLFKFLPDAIIAWRDVWVGGAVTALLFVAGKFLLGFYLGRSDPGSAYGAAGSLALILVWVYYSAMIFLLGAEFAQVWASQKGAGIRPEEGAHRVRQIKVRKEHARGPGRGGPKHDDRLS